MADRHRSPRPLEMDALPRPTSPLRSALRPVPGPLRRQRISDRRPGAVPHPCTHRERRRPLACTPRRRTLLPPPYPPGQPRHPGSRRPNQHWPARPQPQKRPRPAVGYMWSVGRRRLQLVGGPTTPTRVPSPQRPLRTEHRFHFNDPARSRPGRPPPRRHRPPRPPSVAGRIHRPKQMACLNRFRTTGGKRRTRPTELAPESRPSPRGRRPVSGGNVGPARRPLEAREIHRAVTPSLPQIRAKESPRTRIWGYSSLSFTLSLSSQASALLWTHSAAASTTSSSLPTKAFPR